MPLDLPPLPTEAEPASPTPRRDRRFAIGLLLAGVVCIGMGQSVVFAVLPSLGRAVGFADQQVALVFLASSVLWVFLSPYWGRRSDRVGRKPMILLGLAGFSISMFAFAAAFELGLAGALGGAALYALVICARSIYGLIGSATPGAAQGYIADRTTTAERTAGVAGFSAAFGMGAMIGPGVGGAFSAVGPLAPFYAVASLAAAMGVLIALYLPEKSAPIERPQARVRVKLTDARLRPFLAFGAVFGVVNAILIQTIGFYILDVLKFSDQEAPQFIGIGLMAASMASLFSQLVLVQRFHVPPHVLMRGGPALICAGHGLIALSNDFGPIVFGLVLSGFGAGMAIPGFTAAGSLAVGPDEQGSAAGLTNSASSAGFILAPLIAFPLFKIAPEAPFVLTAGLAALLCLYASANGAILRSGRPPA
ncbi:MAG: MFS transporter [Parvularculaceae bacterium]|jgi:MFS family permease|nr:MFS transporter [Parvularculaceae bacterium]